MIAFIFIYYFLIFLASVPVARKAEAVYPCEAEHDSELSFQIGAIFTGGKCYRLQQLLTQNQP